MLNVIFGEFEINTFRSDEYIEKVRNYARKRREEEDK